MTKKLRGKCSLIIGLFTFMAGSLIAGASTNAYDSLHRLTRVVYDNGTSIAYTYDAAGNRLTMLVNSPIPVYLLTVSGGSGGGYYTNNEHVAVIADNPPI